MTVRFSSESDCLIWFDSLNHRKSFQTSLFLKDHFVFVPFILYMIPLKANQCPENSKCIGPLFPASRGRGQSSGTVTSQSGTHSHFFTSHTDPDTTNLNICWYRYVTDTRALQVNSDITILNIVEFIWGCMARMIIHSTVCLIMYSTVCIYAIFSGPLSTSTSHHL